MYKPIRQGKSMRYGNNRWKGFSSKIGRDVFFESSLEYEHWVLLETSNEVVDFCEQPDEASSIYNGKTHHSTFDMWVKYSNGKEEYIEIKYSSDLDPTNKKYEKTLRQISVQEDWCKKKGYAHRVVTDNEIRKNLVFLENMKTILPNIRYFVNIDPELKLRVLNSISTGSNKLEEIYFQLPEYPKSDILTIIYSLIYDKVIISNIDLYKIGKETRFNHYEVKKDN